MTSEGAAEAFPPSAKASAYEFRNLYYRGHMRFFLRLPSLLLLVLGLGRMHQLIEWIQQLIHKTSNPIGHPIDRSAIASTAIASSK